MCGDVNGWSEHVESFQGGMLCVCGVSSTD
jgi:hypothetical protein